MPKPRLASDPTHVLHDRREVAAYVFKAPTTSGLGDFVVVRYHPRSEAFYFVTADTFGS